MSETQIINIIKTVSRKLFPDCDIILFGSRARKDNNINSDYDIMLIIEDYLTPKQKLPFKTQIRKELLKYRILSDVLIQSKQEVEEKRLLTGHIVKTIMNEGIVL
jgi:uncharacterized protein